MVFATDIDGQAIQPQLCQTGIPSFVEGIEVSDSSYRNLEFGKISVTGASHISPSDKCIVNSLKDDDAVEDQYIWQELGSIDIKVLRFTQGLESLGTTADITPWADSSLIHESCKKAGTHRVVWVSKLFEFLWDYIPKPYLRRLGAEQPCAPHQIVCGSYIDTPDEPYARIKFFYRPKGELYMTSLPVYIAHYDLELLQAQGLMPSPVVALQNPSKQQGKEKTHQSNL